MSEDEKFEILLEKFSMYFEETLKRSNIDSISCKQKLLAISSFVEFIKAGASVDVYKENELNIIYKIGLK